MLDIDPVAQAQSIPVYQLYGEASAGLPPGSMHCESIAERSRLYNWNIAPHRHEAFFQILYIEKGGGEALLEAERVRIQSPCLITVPAMSVHGFRFTRNVRGLVVTMIDAHLAGSVAVNAELRRALTTPRVLRLDADSRDAGLVSALFEKAAREFAGNAPWRMETITASLALSLMTAIRDASNAMDRPSGASTRKTRHLQTFQDLVDRKFRSQRRIDFYADRVGISATQLNRVCRELTGKSALDVVSNRVILEAERDLIYTVLEVKQIAISLGFADAAYFSRFFAKRTGTTPGEFRRRARLQLEGAGGRG